MRAGDSSREPLVFVLATALLLPLSALCITDIEVQNPLSDVKVGHNGSHWWLEEQGSSRGEFPGRAPHEHRQLERFGVLVLSGQHPSGGLRVRRKYEGLEPPSCRTEERDVIHCNLKKRISQTKELNYTLKFRVGSEVTLPIRNEENDVSSGTEQEPAEQQDTQFTVDNPQTEEKDKELESSTPQITEFSAFPAESLRVRFRPMWLKSAIFELRNASLSEYFKEEHEELRGVHELLLSVNYVGEQLAPSEAAEEPSCDAVVQEAESARTNELDPQHSTAMNDTDDLKCSNVFLHETLLSPIRTLKPFLTRGYQISKFRCDYDLQTDSTVHDLLDNILSDTPEVGGAPEERETPAGRLEQLQELHINSREGEEAETLRDDDQPYMCDLGLKAALHAPHLRALTIINCSLSVQHFLALTTETPRVLSGTLEVINLTRNSLRTYLASWHPRGEGALLHLRTLNLSRQSYARQNETFHFFPEGVEVVEDQPWFPELRELDLSHTKILRINRTHLSASPRLETLRLRGCNLRELPVDLFSFLQRLALLDLSHNQLVRLPAQLTSLAPHAVLRLCCNNLTAEGFSPLHFSGTVNFVDLSRNRRLRNVTEWVGAGNVENLDISYNNITTWSNPTWFRHVRSVDLSSNRVSHFTRAMLHSLEQLARVELGDNPLDCTHCALRNLQSLLAKNRTRVFNQKAPEWRNRLLCRDTNSEEHNIMVFNAPYNSECLPDLMLYVGLPLFVLAVLVAVVALLLHFYRFEIAYLRHIWRLRRKHKKRAGTNQGGVCSYDAFVSFCAADRAWVVDTLLPALENGPERYRLCLHERDFRVGSHIMDNIGESIEGSKHVILVLSPDYVQSEWCRWELRLVQQRVLEEGSFSDFLVLVQLRSVKRQELCSSLRMLLASLTYLEWTAPLPDPAQPALESATLENGTPGAPNLQRQTSSKGEEEFFRRLRSALGPPQERPPGEDLDDLDDDEGLMTTSWADILDQEDGVSRKSSRRLQAAGGALQGIVNTNFQHEELQGQLVTSRL